MSFIACAALVIGSAASVSVAGITITERETRAENSLWAGSGGAVDQFSEELLEQVELTGPFAFGSSGEVMIVEGGISNGTGNADGTIEVLEMITLSGDSVLTIETARASNGSAQHESGTANAYFTHNSETRLRFETDVPLFYEVTGSFNPDPDANIAFMQLNRPFTTLTFFNFQEPQEINQSGIMPAGNTYQFRVRIRDQQTANAGTPNVDGTNSYNASLTIAPISCAADLDENGTVDLGDLNLVLANFGQEGSSGDANRDGVVDLEDLNLLLAQFAEPCPIER